MRWGFVCDFSNNFRSIPRCFGPRVWCGLLVYGIAEEVRAAPGLSRGFRMQMMFDHGREFAELIKHFGTAGDFFFFSFGRGGGGGRWRKILFFLIFLFNNFSIRCPRNEIWTEIFSATTLRYDDFRE